MSAEYQGVIHKFTIYGSEPVDCYLKIGFVGNEPRRDFPHLTPGEVCFFDLTISKQADDLRVYEFIFELASRLIRCGGTVRDVYSVLIGQQMSPSGTTSNKNIPLCKSIADYVAKYLLEDSHL